MHACMHACIHTYIHMYICIYTYTYMYLCRHAYTDMSAMHESARTTSSVLRCCPAAVGAPLTAQPARPQNSGSALKHRARETLGEPEAEKLHRLPTLPASGQHGRTVPCQTRFTPNVSTRPFGTFSVQLQCALSDLPRAGPICPCAASALLVPLRPRSSANSASGK